MTDTPPSPDDLPDLDEDEADAIHEIELGLEWLHRAHGQFVEAHHKTGHAFDHFEEAIDLLAEAGYDDLADALESEHLAGGVVGDRWTYDLLEEFQEGIYDDLIEFEARAREAVADGQRHVVEREQHRRWTERGDE